MDLESNGVPTAADSRCCGWCKHWFEGCGGCGICAVEVGKKKLRHEFRDCHAIADCMTMYEDGTDCAYYLEVE